MKIFKQDLLYNGKAITIEAGKLAQQADGSVVVTCGETTILATVVFKKEADANASFFPLMVAYKEMAFAAGRIPGGFFKREGRPSEREVITSRLIDRPIRPLFPSDFLHEVQVTCTVLSYDGENDSDILSIIAASAALSISGVPFTGPIGALRVGMLNGEFVINPTIKEQKDLALNLVIAGSKTDILMVEAEAHELSEAKMLEALEFGHKNIQPVINAIQELQKEVGKKTFVYQATELPKDLVKKVEKQCHDKLKDAYQTVVKKEREAKLYAIKQSLLQALVSDEVSAIQVLNAFQSLQEQIVRQNIVKGIRIDGRGTTDIRTVSTEVSILPRTHGSALFNRGETQALVVTTLGSSKDEQMIDSLDGDAKEHFMLHYNFPSYSVGEVAPNRGPGRREIGHGRLASRALRSVLPSKEDFPYTIRVVSEITGCNGSSSMATVCGSSLAMMDAGVPIKAAVAGVAMGLIKLDDKFIILSDIIGAEDALGDMDFKVAGTSAGITALQMDIKVTGISLEIMKEALDQAQTGRLHILEKMSASLSTARTELNKTAPQMTKLSIPKNKIGELIGPGGKNIKAICEATGVTVDINDDGIVVVASTSQEAATKAVAMINGIVDDPEIGKVYAGTIKALLDFGAIVQFMGKREGMVHISEMSNEKVAKVSDVVKEGESVQVKVLEIDAKRGRIRLSMRLDASSNPDEAKERKHHGASSKPSHYDRNKDKPRHEDKPRHDDRPRHEDSKDSRPNHKTHDSRETKPEKREPVKDTENIVTKTIRKYFKV